ncbi:hypothetical protein BJ508DRAFT_169389 [Ascobolus immersus RN42]|uniref:Uncharacterized protein n=1 Tax=Ascobolus immersus RN42 TaxID=1160509 RepID=A0A3N4HV61_ASCIM|nr:hypothetical protein BJ508DRAFT_169389 [Ascobolus immersus RN42]
MSILDQDVVEVVSRRHDFRRAIASVEFIVLAYICRGLRYRRRKMQFLILPCRFRLGFREVRDG